MSPRRGSNKKARREREQDKSIFSINFRKRHVLNHYNHNIYIGVAIEKKYGRNNITRKKAQKTGNRNNLSSIQNTHGDNQCGFSNVVIRSDVKIFRTNIG